MSKVVCSMCVLIVCAFQQSVAQPNNQARENQAAQANSNLSPAIVDSQTQVDEAVKAERERYAKERDRKDDTYKEAQFQQNSVIAQAAVYNVVIAAVYAVVAFLTLLAIWGQSKKAGQQVARMDATLKEMEQQRRTLHTQAIATLSQARSTREALIQTGNLVKQNAEAVELMKGQLVAMQHQEQAQFKTLEVMQRQAATMDRELVYGTRAYVGVHSIVFDGMMKRIFLQIENIGKVPAKNIDVTVELMIRIPDHLMPPAAPDGTRRGWGLRKVPRNQTIYGFDPEILDYWELRIPWLQPCGCTKLFPGSMKFGIMIRLDEILYITPSQYQAITAGHAKMFVRGIIQYSDGFHSGKRTEFAFRYYLKDNIWIAIPDTGFEKFHGEPEKPDSDYNPN